MRTRSVSLLFSLIGAATLSAQPHLTFDYPPIAPPPPLDPRARAPPLVEKGAAKRGGGVLAIAHRGTSKDLRRGLRWGVMRAGGIALGVGGVRREPVPAAFAPAVLIKGARE